MSTVFVVIVSYRSGSAAIELARQMASDVSVTKVIIVDNSASEAMDGRVSTGRLDDRIEVLAARSNLGYAGGNNEGVRRALVHGASHVLVLNPDVAMPIGAVGDLLSEMTSLGVDLISPSLVERDHHGRVVVYRRPGFDLLLGRGVLQAPENHRFESTFFGAAFLVTSAVFMKHGLLDERLFLYCEEVEFVSRARRQESALSFAISAVVEVPHGRGVSVSPDGYHGGGRSHVSYEESARSVVIFGRDYHPWRLALWMAARAGVAGALAVRDPRAAFAVLRGVGRGIAFRKPSRSSEP